MGKKKGKSRKTGESSAQQEGEGTSGEQQPQSQQQGARGRGQQQPQAQQQGAQSTGQQPQAQQQGARGRGQQQPQAQQQGAQSTGQQPQAQQQGAWGRGQQQPQAQQQGAWGRGQQQPQAQQQGAWGRGQQQPQAQQQRAQSTGQQPQAQQQGAWGRGQQQPQAQQQGAWGRGQQPQAQQQGAWGRGQQQPQAQQQHAQSTGQQPQAQQQGAWGRGQQQPQAQQQGAWGRGQQPQAQQQGAWGRGQQPQAQQQGAWGRGQQQPQAQQQGAQVDAPVPQAQSQPQKERDTSSVSDKKQKKGPGGDGKSPETVSSFQFSPRIEAAKKSGRPITVATNFFPLIIGNPDIVVCHYDVVFEPDKPKYLLRSVWNKYMSLVFPGRLTAFDGKNAYSNGPLTDAAPPETTITVFNEQTGKDKEFKVSIKEVRRISFACFRENYRAKMLRDRSLKVLPEEEIAVLDIILRNYACDNYVKSGRTFFPLVATSPLSRDMSNKLSLRFGYFQAAFLGYNPYLNFDLSHKAFYKEGPVLNILDCFRHRHTKEIDIEGMNRFMRTVKVEYQLPNDPSSRRIFTVNKLAESANRQEFKKEDGTTQTVAEYFSREKKVRLRHPDLPLLWVGSRQKSIYLPMELCKIVPDQVYKGLVDPFETREMVRGATSNARDRRRDVCDLLKQVNINTHPLMKEFQLRVSEEMKRVDARVLDPPALKATGRVGVNDGGWRIRGFLEPGTLRKWCIVIVDRQVPKQSVMNLQGMLRERGSNFNMKIEEATRNPIEADPSVAGLKKAFSQLKDMEMVFVIISEAKGLYGRVKGICETEEGILTQCIKSKTVSQDPRKLQTTVDNILLKVNAKLGGKNHSLDAGSAPSCLNGYVMVVGADVTHPSPGMAIPSVAAVAVSCDPVAFQYGMTRRLQPKGEMIKDLQEIMTIHLKKFHELRKNYPEKIIFFRDGVSEGEMEKVLKGELAAVRRACEPYCRPKITFVIVQKRHHTRLYPTRGEDEIGKNFNVPVGTCVDTEIVHPRDLDFYLVSHSSILGTARPTRYRLLHDDNRMTDDEVERLSFYLCHLFARCNRSVSYPSPTYNAHLAAARVRAYLEGMKIADMENIDDIQKKMPDMISNISPMFYV